MACKDRCWMRRRTAGRPAETVPPDGSCNRPRFGGRFPAIRPGRAPGRLRGNAQSDNPTIEQVKGGEISPTHSTDKVPGGKNVLVEFEDQVAWVTLNRPEKRNCMSPALNDEMVEVLDTLELDDRCGVLVLTGAGDSFSAGMDLREFFRATDGLS